MDANIIRLILIVVGASLILLLYLWERHRERTQELDEGEDDLDESDLDEPYGVRHERQAPDAARPPPARAESRLAQQPSARAPAAPPESDRKTATPLEPLLIQLSVSARQTLFKGPELLEVAESCGLHPGEMDIFHCLDEFDDETRIYFSMANLVKPGRFPFAAMDDFSTPGLILFAQLEGDPEDLTILDEMIAAARKLATLLNGEVLDDTRRTLTPKKQDDLRQAVLENQRRWAQAVAH